MLCVACVCCVRATTLSNFTPLSHCLSANQLINSLVSSSVILFDKQSINRCTTLSQCHTVWQASNQSILPSVAVSHRLTDNQLIDSQLRRSVTPSDRQPVNRFLSLSQCRTVWQAVNQPIHDSAMVLHRLTSNQSTDTQSRQVSSTLPLFATIPDNTKKIFPFSS